MGKIEIVAAVIRANVDADERLIDTPEAVAGAILEALKRPVSGEMQVRLEASRDELRSGGPIGVMRYCYSCQTHTGRDADGVVWQHSKSCPRI